MNDKVCRIYLIKKRYHLKFGVPIISKKSGTEPIPNLRKFESSHPGHTILEASLNFIINFKSKGLNGVESHKRSEEKGCATADLFHMNILTMHYVL